MTGSTCDGVCSNGGLTVGRCCCSRRIINLIAQINERPNELDESGIASGLDASYTPVEQVMNPTVQRIQNVDDMKYSRRTDSANRSVATCRPRSNGESNEEGPFNPKPQNERNQLRHHR
jgi:hypothetical protein